MWFPKWPGMLYAQALSSQSDLLTLIKINNHSVCGLATQIGQISR